MKAKDHYEYNLERIQEINEKREKLKKERKKLSEENHWLLADNCKWRNEKEQKCDYDNTPLNKDGYECSDCVTMNYSHISFKED
jgi:hypothetical protein